MEQGATPAEVCFLVIDDGIAALDHHRPPNPLAFFNGPRRLRFTDSIPTTNCSPNGYLMGKVAAAVMTK